MKFQKGFTLIEFMLSLTIMIIIVGGLISIFISAEKNTVFENTLATLQENSLVASLLLKNAIQAAGYIGCARLTKKFPLSNHTSVIFNVENRFIKNTNNTFTVMQASFSGSTLIKPMRGLSTIYTTDNAIFKPDEIVLISDCNFADLFKIKESEIVADKAQKITTNEPLSHFYQADAVVRPLEENTYFIKESALSVQNIQQKKSELVSGIDAMQIQINTHNNEIKGVGFTLDYVTQGLSKKEYLYAALRN